MNNNIEKMHFNISNMFIKLAILKRLQKVALKHFSQENKQKKNTKNTYIGNHNIQAKDQ